jgi:hypothetical protein
MSFAQYTNRFTHHPLMQFGGATSFSPEDKLLKRLGASSSQPVFGSQSILTQELQQSQNNFSQESLNSVETASSTHSENNGGFAAVESKGNDVSHGAMTQLSSTSSNQDYNSTRPPDTTSQNSPIHFSGVHSHLELQAKEGYWDSLLNAVDISLMEQSRANHDTDGDGDELQASTSSPFTCESLISAYGARPTKPAATTKADKNRSVAKVAKRSTKHVLRDQSPNHRAEPNDETNRRRSSRHPKSKLETTCVLPMAPIRSPVSNKTKNSKTATTLPLVSEPTRSSNRANKRKVTVSMAKDAIILAAVWPSGQYASIAAIAPPEKVTKQPLAPKPKTTVNKAKRTRSTKPAASPAKPTRTATTKLQQQSLPTKKNSSLKVTSVADLMGQMLEHCPTATKELYVHMVNTHAQPANRPIPAPGVLDLSFQWNYFPPLEHIVLKNMARYYELSSRKNHFREQFAFNNMLCQQVNQVAKQYGWELPSDVTTRQVRDRIRCFYKTLIQNAKKRLSTLLRDRTDVGLQQLKELWKRYLESAEVQDFLTKKRLNGNVWA